MKINNKIFSLPPHISTNWSNVRALHMKGTTLVVNLTDGEFIEIPGLDPSLIENIFNTHASFMERQSSGVSINQTQGRFIPPFTQMLVNAPADHRIDIPFRLGVGTFDEIGSVMQHNPAQAGAPDLPQEILQKIVAITKIVAPEDILMLPKAEGKCNCVHCQIARAMQGGESPELAPVLAHTSHQEEAVSEKELQFQQWDISQTGDNMYTVINRLDPVERYSVFLGEPVGCTCGKQGCEHIVSVLKS